MTSDPVGARVAEPDALGAEPVQDRLVGERDRELAEHGGVERSGRVKPLHVRLGRAQLVPGEVGLR